MDTLSGFSGRVITRKYMKNPIFRQAIALMLLMLPLAAGAAMDKESSVTPTENVNRRKVGAIEGGVQMGLNVKMKGNEKSGWNLGAEMRYNLKSAPVDIGVLADVGMIPNDFFDIMPKLELLSDYNFRQTSKFSQFLGCGIGITAWNCDDCFGSDHIERTCIISPRAGVEILKFLRLTCMLNMPCSDMALTHVTFSIGLCLGGWNRKK